MSVADWQRRLDAFGYGLSIDGVAGPRTFGAIFAYMGARDTAAAFGSAAARYFPCFGIQSPLRVAHFMAQATEETDGFRYLSEIWGPTSAQRAYEDNPLLGNTQPGDGFKYRGRGIFQLTGRANYDRYSALLDLDLIDNPTLAAQPDVALHIACLYWNDHRLNDYADADNILGVSNGINRGNPASIKEPNGFEQRKAALAKIKAVVS